MPYQIDQRKKMYTNKNPSNREVNGICMPYRTVYICCFFNSFSFTVLCYSSFYIMFSVFISSILKPKQWNARQMQRKTKKYREKNRKEIRGKKFVVERYMTCCIIHFNFPALMFQNAFLLSLNLCIYTQQTVFNIYCIICCNHATSYTDTP